ncbi:hypothetical protein [Actinomadura luteofluorescens]|uniref:hypothetical protein n=1 Tax=Actinomadura luteofluorescens TaxID=46163 RepID=UPI003D8A22A0
MKWVEPKHWNVAAPTSSITPHLDRLVEAVVREGWQAVPRYDGPRPLVHVFDRDAPQFGESITLAPGPVPRVWWFRSSTGENLALHTDPSQAARQITRILIPYVTAIRAARSHRAQRAGTPSPTPPAVPDPAHVTTIAELEKRFAGLVCWWGRYTYEWWAIVPGGTQWTIVNAEEPDSLLHEILRARKRR